MNFEKKDPSTFRQPGENPNPYRRPSDPIERSKEGTRGRETEDSLLDLIKNAGDVGISVSELIEFFKEHGPRFEQSTTLGDISRMEKEPGARVEVRGGEEIISVPIVDSDDIQDGLFTLESVGMIEIRDKKAYLRRT